jgi:predicted nucleotidyltransferase
LVRCDNSDNSEQTNSGKRLMPEALILFGSVARGSETPTSDVDMLAVGGDTSAYSVKCNGVEIQNYTVDKFMSMAREGDLFGAHIAMEGKSIFDPHGVFVKYRETYSLKNSYLNEKKCAFDLANFLLFHGGTFENKDLVARRFAWAVRTVLIATLAEKGKFVFSPEGLHREFPYPWAFDLINLRRDGAGKPYASAVIEFLAHFENTQLPLPQERYFEIFEETRNTVALGTLQQLNEIERPTPYPNS